MGFITTARQAEQSAAAVMRYLGYSDASTTAVGPDSGIDIVSSTALAQVKWQGAVVGRPELQRLVGARGRDIAKGLLFFAASGFSQAAVDYADDLEIALFVYDPTGIPTAQNLLAHKVIHRAILAESDSDDCSPEEENAVPPVELTEEEAAAEIVEIVNEMSFEKFNSLDGEVRQEVIKSYEDAIIVAYRLSERFNDPELAELYDQQVEQEYNWRREAEKEIQKEKANEASLQGVEPVTLNSREFRESYLKRREEKERGQGSARVSLNSVLSSDFGFVDPLNSTCNQIEERKFRNPFDPRRAHSFPLKKDNHSRTVNDHYFVDISLNPLYETHFDRMPFKFDSDGCCFAYDSKRKTYESFDNEMRKFLNPYDRRQEMANRRAASAARRMRTRAETIRNL